MYTVRSHEKLLTVIPGDSFDRVNSYHEFKIARVDVDIR